MTNDTYHAESETLKTAIRFMGQDFPDCLAFPDLPLDLSDTLTRFIADFVFLNSNTNLWDEQISVLRMLNMFEPTQSVESGANRIAYWPDLRKREISHGADLDLSAIAKLRVMGKPGKAFKRFFPNAPDQIVAQFVDEYNKEYSPTRYTLRSGQSRADFRHAYNHDLVAFQNPCLGGYRKNLSNSCMRGYHFSGWDYSPAEAFASGDFTIFWIEDSDGKIAARVVCRTHDSKGIELETPRYAPIYGCTEIAICQTENHLTAIGAIPARDNSSDMGFLGARLLMIPHRGAFLACYADIEPGRADDIGSDLMKICHHGDYTMTSTSGLTKGGNSCSCVNCSESIDEEDSYTCDNGNTYCQDCYNESFSTCENCDSLVDSDFMTQVYTAQGNRNNDSQDWCSRCVRSHSTECHDGEIWSDDCVTDSGCGNSLSPDDMDSGDFVFCDDGEIYRHDLTGQDNHGNFRLIEDMECDGMEMDSNNVWHMPDDNSPPPAPRCDLTPDLFASLPLPPCLIELPECPCPSVPVILPLFPSVPLCPSVPLASVPLAPVPLAPVPLASVPLCAPVPDRRSLTLANGAVVLFRLVYRAGASCGVVFAETNSEYHFDIRVFARDMVARELMANPNELESAVIPCPSGRGMFFGVAFDYPRALRVAQSFAESVVTQ